MTTIYDNENNDILTTRQLSLVVFLKDLSVKTKRFIKSRKVKYSRSEIFYAWDSTLPQKRWLIIIWEFKISLKSFFKSKTSNKRLFSSLT